MKKRLCIGLILALTVFLCACGPEYSDLHSDLYLSDYSAQQIVKYFDEVVLHAEYSDGTGNTSVVQKWKDPIRYYIYGDPTDEDLAVLEQLFAQLNQIEGFPGIHPVSNGEELHNLSISFLDRNGFNDAFSSAVNGEDAYGAAQFWYYTATNEIHTAKVGYRTDIDQANRSSVLLEEIVNMLGVSDTVLRQDSIVYQYSNSNMALSDVDWVILKVLYNSAVDCGMDADSCKAIIEQLYY